MGHVPPKDLCIVTWISNRFIPTRLQTRSCFWIALPLIFLIANDVNATVGVPSFRFTSDGLGFSVLRSGVSTVNCPILQNEVNITGYGTWPAGFVQGPAAFYGGVFDGSSLWLVPFDAADVIRIDTLTGNMTRHYDWPAGFVKGSGAFYGGTFDGTFVWLAPSTADRVLRIDPKTGAMVGFKDWPSGFVKGASAFAGAVFDGSAVWLIPSMADRLIRIDPVSGNMTGHKNWPSGFTPSGMGFYGGVFDGSGIWLVPGNADRVIRLDTSTGNMTDYLDWPSGIVRGAFGFVGGVFDGASIWLVPYTADRVVRINASNGNMTGYRNWPSGFGKGLDGFSGGVFDGTSIWLVPYKADRLVRLDPSTGNMTGYANWPSGFPKPTRTFIGAVFDGSAVWMVPGEADLVMKVSSNCSVTTRTVSPTATTSLALSETSTRLELSSSRTQTKTKTRGRRNTDSTSWRTLTVSTISPSQTISISHSIRTRISTPGVLAGQKNHTNLLSQTPSNSFSQTEVLLGQTSPPHTFTPRGPQMPPNRPSEPVANLFNSETISVVVRATGGTSAVLSSFVASPSTASRALRVGTVARVIDCAFVDSDAEPSYMDLPVQATVGRGEFGAVAGSTVASTGTLIVLPFLALSFVALYGRQRKDCTWVRRLQQNVVANFCFMALGYIGPNIFYSLILVVLHGGTGAEVGAVSLSATAVSLLTMVVAVVLLNRFHSWFRVIQGETTHNAEGSSRSPKGQLKFENRQPHSMLLETFGPVFDGTRSDAAILRASYLEELVLSILLQGLSGIRPQSGECGAVAISMAVCAGLHAAYVVSARPYSDPLELLFAILTALLLLSMALVAAATVFLGEIRSLMTALGVLLFLQNASFFAQLVVMGFAVLKRSHRKRLEHQWACKSEPQVNEKELENVESMHTSGLTLETPMLLDVTDTPASARRNGTSILNPLGSGTAV